MKLSGGESLSKHLERLCLPIYLIHGDDPLLVDEALQALRNTLKKKGFSERNSFVVDSTFDLAHLQDSTQNRSLFAEKKQIELHCGDKMPADLSLWIQHYASEVKVNPDLSLTVVCSKLSAQQQKVKWVAAVESVGVVVTIWSVSLTEYPAWLDRRLIQKGLKLTPAARIVLGEETEGNLEAAMQVLSKLERVAEKGAIIDVDQVEPLLTHHSNYDLFDLTSQVLLGNLKRSLKILDFLEQGGDVILVLWALAREVKMLLQIEEQRARVPLQTLYRTLNIWEKRQFEVEAALKRIAKPKLYAVLGACSDIDLMVKGLKEGSPWFHLKQMVVSLCGK